MRSCCCLCVCARALCMPLSLLDNGPVKIPLSLLGNGSVETLPRNEHRRNNIRIVGRVVFSVARVVSRIVGD
jgi:hypothetical protein